MPIRLALRALPGTFTITLTEKTSRSAWSAGASDTCTAVCKKLGTACNQGGLTTLAARYTKSDETYEDFVTNVLKLKMTPITATTFSTKVTKDIGYFGFGCSSGVWSYKAGVDGLYGCGVGKVTTERDAEPKCDTVQHRDGSFHGPSLCVCGDVDTSATAAPTKARTTPTPTPTAAATSTTAPRSGGVPTDPPAGYQLQ